LKTAIVSVINDLATDRRVDKTCMCLVKLGFEVKLTGRKKRDSITLPGRDYQMHRMKLIFEKGPLFYAEFNIRLFIYLFFHRANLLISNDLDTLLPNYLISKIKNIPLVYDSHEYFTETPELVNRKFVKAFWKFLERNLMPRIIDTITVNDSIAGLYHARYGISPFVVRNIPPSVKKFNKKTRKELHLPENKKIVVLQGSGINIQRGAEELVKSAQYLQNTMILIIGGGDVLPDLKRMCAEMDLADRIMFIPKVPFEELMQYTANADIGITIDKDTNINYHFSLPNKLFDYIHAGIPVLASRLPEIERIIVKYNIGDFISSHDPVHIAERIGKMLANPEKLEIWKENLKFAAIELNWEEEEKKLVEVLKKYA